MWPHNVVANHSLFCSYTKRRHPVLLILHLLWLMIFTSHMNATYIIYSHFRSYVISQLIVCTRPSLSKCPQIIENLFSHLPMRTAPLGDLCQPQAGSQTPITASFYLSRTYTHSYTVTSVAGCSPGCQEQSLFPLVSPLPSSPAPLHVLCPWK